jgi:hypothetical protein
MLYNGSVPTAVVVRAARALAQGHGGFFMPDHLPPPIIHQL